MEDLLDLSQFLPESFQEPGFGAGDDDEYNPYYDETFDSLFDRELGDMFNDDHEQDHLIGLKESFKRNSPRGPNMRDPLADDIDFWRTQSEDEVRRKILQLAEEIELEYQQEKKLAAAAAAAASARPTNVMIVNPKVKHDVRPPLDEYVQCDPTMYGIEESSEKSASPLHQDSRKRRLCRHFLKGHCKRGNSCDFLHDNSIFCPDGQKVFLGGLPAHISADDLCKCLAERGYTVINKPKVLRGFTPQVCLSTLEQAQRLIASGKICIDGSMVDVRPYEDKKPNDDIKCSVFLGGLPNGMTTATLKMELGLLGIKVKNHPIMKVGFTPQVVVGSPEEAQMLIRAKKMCIAGKMVDVRPYVNFRKRY